MQKYTRPIKIPGRRAMIPLLALFGLLAVLALGATAASAAETSEWRADGSPITQAKAATFTGFTRIYMKTGYPYPNFEVSCEDSGTANVGPKAKGEITKLTFTKCIEASGSQGCGIGTPSVEAKRLPWSTELSLSSEKFHYAFLSGSEKRETDVVVKCERLGEIPCLKVPAEVGKNGAEGVRMEELYAESAKTPMTCNTFGPNYTGTPEGAQTYRLVNQESLTLHSTP